MIDSMTKERVATGRRKESTARVRLKPGSGHILVNGKPIREYLQRATLVMISNQPFDATETKNKFDARIRAEARLSSLERDRWNLLEDDRPGSATKVELIAAWRARPWLELDGEGLLTWSPPGTAYTDVLLATAAAAGARVTPVEAHITGGTSLRELAETGAVALVPRGWPDSAGTVAVELRDEVRLPLVALWRAGAPPPAARRLRAGMGASADQ